MRNYSEQEIEHYLLCNESLDKAGAYSIQGEGRNLIESVRGNSWPQFGLPSSSRSPPIWKAAVWSFHPTLINSTLTSHS